MKTLTSITIVVCMLISTLALQACSREADTAQTDATTRCEHDIKTERCPFCNPELIESDGFCGEHGVAEALCYLCRPYLKAAFRAKGDWCAEHNAPDSQCMVCHPELKANIRPGEGHGAPLPTDTIKVGGDN